MYIYTYQTKIGPITIHESNNKITKILINEKNSVNTEESNLTKQTIKEINEYLDHKRTDFTIPLDPQGTDHQIKVWNELKKIPYSETRTYKELATSLGNPNASRAIGSACGKNPIMIIVPCHRVIGTNGKLTGYAGGIGVKEKLIDLETKLGK
ncbi:MAG: methylated-DNA--[protein]-cysteine S-methyltransferase [Erysipelothrix sp.]|nr:methylated-DNA--[protein]-cysteine S-methyltransferase [Erysipelothrix sp.]